MATPKPLTSPKPLTFYEAICQLKSSLWLLLAAFSAYAEHKAIMHRIDAADERARVVGHMPALTDYFAPVSDDPKDRAL